MNKLSICLSVLYWEKEYPGEYPAIGEIIPYSGDLHTVSLQSFPKLLAPFILILFQTFTFTQTKKSLQPLFCPQIIMYKYYVL